MVKAKKQIRSEQEENVVNQLLKFTDINKDMLHLAQTTIASERVYAVQAYEKSTLDKILENPNAVFKYERMSDVVLIVRWSRTEDYVLDLEAGESK